MEEVESRKCNVCGIEKPTSELVASARYIGGFMPLCKPCRNEYWRLRRAVNPGARKKHGEAVQRSKILRQYGLTSADYADMLMAQGGKCKLCRASEHGRTERFKFWNVDHCHKTGAVRGLLCHMCNITLGKLEILEAKIGRAAIFSYIDTQGGVDEKALRQPGPGSQTSA